MTSPKEKFIAHVDMDAFFTSIEQRDNPAYRKKPVIVGSDPKNGKGRGVVAACSYEARKFGIHSAMPISVAYKKCPGAVFLPVDGAKYAAVSRRIFELFERFTPDVEPISIDEAFLDITGSYHLFGTPLDVCRMVKALITKEMSLTASVGLAPNKMTAKIASDIDKPDGLVAVRQENLLKFLHPLPVEKLWGVGKKTSEILAGAGIKTVGDLAARSRKEMSHCLGRNGEHAWELANGIDPREVETIEVIKSIGNEHTFEEDTREEDRIKDALMFLSEKVSRRLRRAGLKGKTITLKLRFSDFKTYTRSVTVESPVNFVDIIFENALRKLKDFDHDKRPIRLIGVSVSNLADTSHPDDLFGEDSDQTRKKESLHKALDHILDTFGEGALRRRKA